MQDTRSKFGQDLATAARKECSAGSELKVTPPARIPHSSRVSRHYTVRLNAGEAYVNSMYCLQTPSESELCAKPLCNAMPLNARWP